ncbi:MAG: 3-phosphoshikimate 1-carboxyvinyltransferase [Candidatus Hydrogenedentales bacterium]
MSRPATRLLCRASRLQGAVNIPGSKSHTIRAVALAALAEGESVIRAPLLSEDAEAAVRVYGALGARITRHADEWRVQGFAGEPSAPTDTLDVGNSGTTMNVALGACSLLRAGEATLTGDAQIQRRPSGVLAASLNDLGAQVRSHGNNGCPPITVGGRLRGGETRIEARSSQYLTSLLLCTPLAEEDTLIHVPLLYEQPYVEMTLDWLDRLGIALEYAEDYSEFRVRGGQSFRTFDRRIPGDFSSATFFLAAGALGDNEVMSRGLDRADTQGDRAVLDYLQQMGAAVSERGTDIVVRANGLRGCELDLNATPDALPMMAVLGCFAQGETRLVNVPQARQKETDRIAVMREELERLGADIEELPDGLVIRESKLRGAHVDGHGDHRVVMALAIAGTCIPGETVIGGAEAAAVTYPEFVAHLQSIGGDAVLESE